MNYGFFALAGFITVMLLRIVRSVIVVVVIVVLVGIQVHFI